MDPTSIKMGFVYGNGQIVGVEKFCTYFTYVAIYVVNVGIVFLLAPRGDFSHVEMCIFESLNLLMSSFTLFIGPLISFVPRWKTTASVSSHIYPFNQGISCPILIPDVLYTQTASGLSSFGFSCLASPRILESPMIHFFY